MSDPATPPSPDYVGAANAQGQANLAAARLNAQLGRVNYVTPYGSLTYSNGSPGASSGTGSTGGNALPGTGYNRTQIPYSGSALTGGTYGFGGSGYGSASNYGFGSSSPSDSYTATISLAPEQQQLLNAQNQQSQGLANLANRQIGNVNQSLSGSLSAAGLPSLSGSPNQGKYQYSVNNPNVQSSIDTSGVTGLPTDLSALQNKATDAAMSRQTQQINQQQDSLTAQLANQGISPGSEAYNRAMQPLQQARVDATNQAFLTGTNYENQLYNQGLATNNQQFNQAQSQGQFANSAAAQQFAQGLSSAQLGNSAVSQQYQNQLSGNALNNAARGQGLQEASYLRSQPLNELNALRSGSQVTMPSFGMGGSGGSAGGVQAGNYQNAAAQQGAWNQAMYGNDVSSYNSQMSGLMTAAAMAAMYMSDRRLKRKIRRIGTTAGGIPYYSFTYLWGEQSHGIMADEAPHAIAGRVSGFDVVDYRKVA